MKASVLVITSMFFAVSVLSQPDTTFVGAEKLKVLSWNIYMLPGLLRQHQVARAEAIGEIISLSDYDVIVFQEAFHRKARKTISRLLQPAFPFQAGPANRKTIALSANSGVWIFSKLPIKETHSIQFRTRKGIDGLSRKGALLVEVSIGMQRVQIVGTHLQNAGDPWLRHSQGVELFHRLLKVQQKTGVPQIICGDFNINRHNDTADYQYLLQTLDANDGTVVGDGQYSYDRALNDLKVEQGKRRDLIDYILVRPNLVQLMADERRIRVFQKRWHPDHKDLSDHYPIEAEVKFLNFDPSIVVIVK